jgi:hypothetical protein
VSDFYDHLDYLESLREIDYFKKGPLRSMDAFDEDTFEQLTYEYSFNVPEHLIDNPLDLAAYTDAEQAAFTKAIAWMKGRIQGHSVKPWLLLLGSSGLIDRSAAIIAQFLERQALRYGGGLRWHRGLWFYDPMERQGKDRAYYYDDKGKGTLLDCGIVIQGIDEVYHGGMNALKELRSTLFRLEMKKRCSVVITMNSSFDELKQGFRKCDPATVSTNEFLDRMELAIDIPKLLAKKCAAIVFNQ